MNFFFKNRFVATPLLSLQRAQKPRSTLARVTSSLTLASLYYLWAQSSPLLSSHTPECCGIVGYVGNQPKAGKVCV